MNNKKSVGVITFFAYNYGAFLQAYALQKTMENIGFDCELINYDYIQDRTLLGIPWSNIKNPIKFCASVFKKLILLKRIKKQTAIIAQSLQKNLRISNQRYKSARQLRESPPQYDIYLTGSDQVWNPNINTQGFETRLLDFVDPSQGKLVSYAASIGLAEFPKDKIALTEGYLMRFDAISVREEEAKNILATFINKDIQRHIDPTLLREKEDWLEFSKPINEIREPYIFVYMLANQPELVKYANNLSKQLNLKIVSVGNGMAFQNRILSDQILSPEQFVWGIANAEYVVANSFHATCFSILFKKKARIFIPPTVQCRIVELIKGCNLLPLLEDSIIKNSDIEGLYLDADKYLVKERKRAYEYLAHLKDLE